MSKVQEVLSKLAGKAKMAKAALRGDTGVLSTLEGEHAEVAMLMRAVLDEGHDDHDPEALECRRELYHRIRVGLLAHAKAEEQEFYGVLELRPATHDRVGHSELEHKEIEHLIRRLDHMAESDVGWMPTFASLQMKVEAHVREEETALFDEAKLVLDEQELRDIDDRYQRAKRRFQDVLDSEPYFEHEHPAPV
jgi:Hemerythrin HHE cation binding domain